MFVYQYSQDINVSNIDDCVLIYSNLSPTTGVTFLNSNTWHGTQLGVRGTMAVITCHYLTTLLFCSQNTST